MFELLYGLRTSRAFFFELFADSNWRLRLNWCNFAVLKLFESQNETQLCDLISFSLPLKDIEGFG